MWPSGNTHTRYGVSHILSRKTQGKIKILPTSTIAWGFRIIKPGLYINASEYAPGRATGPTGNQLFLNIILFFLWSGRRECRARAFSGLFPSLSAFPSRSAQPIAPGARSAVAGMNAVFRRLPFPEPRGERFPPLPFPSPWQWNARSHKFRLDYRTALKYVYSRQSP